MNETYDLAICKLKLLASDGTTLRYTDTMHPIVNASKVGLGTSLPKDDKQVTFVSKALTVTEQRCANKDHYYLAYMFSAK